ncbi:MAG: DNA-processing protein DprA, partial [Lentimicrobiaceae bacterium]|nr:DNA-processing protein DprA [Lentimicrobiaceae bacterium]
NLSNEYPEMLKNIENPPLILYIKGKMPREMRRIAVVGTREPDNRSMDNARKIGKILAEKNICVISGLAFGIDAAAHNGCMDSGGVTGAVLAHGLDMIYPKENKQLSDKMLETNGFLMSEYEVGIKPERFRFIRRDRIQSGMSEAIIIVQTSVSGGAMKTAKFAYSQGRRLGVIVNDELHLDKFSGNKIILQNFRGNPLFSLSDLKKFIL